MHTYSINIKKRTNYNQGVKATVTSKSILKRTLLSFPQVKRVGNSSERFLNNSQSATNKKIASYVF